MALDRILEAKRQSVAARMGARPLETFRGALRPSDRDLLGALEAAELGLILECKRASPSAGALREVPDVAQLGRELAAVASGISVLTDEPFFGGSFEDLRRVRETVACPVLCKDFVIDPYQIYEARHHGADAILLMLSVLDQPGLERCLAVCRELRMTALVEVHDREELERALVFQPALLGINNRNLKTLAIDLRTTEELAPRVPKSTRLISESGIEGRGDLRRLRPLVDGFLVGSALMRRPDLGRAARELAYGRVKVCGLTRPEDALAAWRSGATFGGLVFATESPRRVGVERARELTRAAPLGWVGVFVNQPEPEVAELAHELGLAAVQLHGEESAESVAELRERLPAGCQLWKAERVVGALPPLLRADVDRVLLDAHRAERRGGTGASFDWGPLERWPARGEVILAGGLRPENAARADALRTWALDVSSGVEAAPGEKDEARLAAFFAALRRGSEGRR
ncbi:MAG: bifunctional indole-3-glycerol-phosphate synthase TrpC/phosphoribosylanthranilate isomerase TrpF [Deltaproteobacteria bacterium]|nr:bifunctional indole-3-glycerol-phosphate synthase TrpC/phosphoribosylanthranilate isomerase TrpF [Deltaproteobacteria bacterium]